MTDYLTYYEILEIAESATEEEIKEAYRRLTLVYHPDRFPPHLKQYATEKFKLINEAYQVLSNPDKRRQYDDLLKKAQTSTSYENQQLEVNKRNFEFLNIRTNSYVSDSFTISNIGGGTLSGSITTNKNWLTVSQSNIDTTRHKQDITFYIDTSGLPFGLSETGAIEIQSNGGMETVYVTISIEVDKVDLSRFRSRLTIGGLTIGGLFGFLIYYLFQDTILYNPDNPVTVLVFCASIIIVIIVASKLGYEDGGGGGGAFGLGCFSLIVSCIIFGILVNYFRYTFMTVGCALIYGTIANILSQPLRKALWRGDKTIPITVIAGTVVLTTTIISIGLSVSKRDKFLGSYNTPGFAFGVYVSGSTAYVADGQHGGLQIIDVSDFKGGVARK